MQLIGQVIAVVLVFGIVVFVHELGHFLAAKRAGVFAPRFSIGFGPALWKRKWGETEYVLAAIPLGGYVRMASREDDAMAAIEGGGETGLAIPPDRYFEAKSLPVRVSILVAGVTMNIVLGFVVLTLVAYSEGRQSPPSRVVSTVAPIAEAPALATALLAGDTILSIDARPVTNWGDVLTALLEGHANPLRITTQRGEQTIALTGNADSARLQVARSVRWATPSVLGDVYPDGPADRARLLPGDSILSAAGEPVRTWETFVRRIKDSPDKDIPLEISRGGTRMQLVVRPQGRAEKMRDGTTQTVGKIDVAEPMAREPIGAREAVSDGWRQTWGMAGLIVVTVKQYFSGEMSLKTLSGPVGIARQAAASARLGFKWVLVLLAALSINVAVLNLLPIPILDGGQILMNVIESAKGSAFTMRTREYILRFGFAAIALLFVIVMYNDIVPGVTRLVRSIFQR
ncbi:MAG: RIP metalloprotease RseP [Gemmatimonadaceae bacterium]